uniref:Histone deacetylase domain-containing protein n=1 Tax=Oryza punctata TaxID=4537 RepID=A0A0E0LCU6_ORYPU
MQFCKLPSTAPQISHHRILPSSGRLAPWPPIPLLRGSLAAVLAVSRRSDSSPPPQLRPNPPSSLHPVDGLFSGGGDPAGAPPPRPHPLQQALPRRPGLQGSGGLLAGVRHRLPRNREAVHSESYLNSLKSSLKVASIVEVPPVALIPNWLVQQKLLYPFRKQVGGSILSAKLALERGWAINVGGGFHHCSAEEGGGFCAYADISLCIQFAFVRLNISRVMIIDLDAHQGNGHEKDFANDGRVYTLDMYNAGIYPYDHVAKRYIDQKVELVSGTKTEDYLDQLEKALKVAESRFQPQLIVYNAGTDILDGDPLGRLKISPEGVMIRDEKVFRFAKDQNIPLLMLTSVSLTSSLIRSKLVCSALCYGDAGGGGATGGAATALSTAFATASFSDVSSQTSPAYSNVLTSILLLSFMSKYF